MKVNKNLILNRFSWAQQTVEQISIEKGDHLILYDIGSRDGNLKTLFENLNLQYNAYDLDPLNESVIKWDIETPYPYDNKRPDIITFLEVIEHLNNPWLCFKNLNSILNAKGRILISTPNPGWSDSRLHLLLKGKLTCFTQADLDLNHHVFTPWPHIIEKLLDDTGFKIIEYSTIDGKTDLFIKPLGGLRFPVQLLYRVSKKIIEFFDKSACGMSYVIVAEKK